VEQQQVDWDVLETNLKDAEEVYSDTTVYGKFTSKYVLPPLRKRFDAGERSKELAKEIKEISL
jgi:hypothetical protein